MSDSNFSSVTLLATFEGGFADSSNSAQTSTTHASPTIVSSTPSPPTGAGASAKFVQASSQFVDFGTSTTMDPGAGDFTAEAWFNLASLHSYNSIITKGDQINAPTNLGWGIWVSGSSDIVGLAYDGSTRVNIQGTGLVSTSTWYHCAIVRASGTWSLFFNGNRIGTSTNASGTISNSTRKLCIGADDTGSGNDNFLNGDVSYARVTPGVARYSGATYTIPTIPTSYSGNFISAGTGSFSLTGEAATFQTAQAAAQASFALTGNAATFRVATAAIGTTVALTGSAATFRITEVASQGAFSLTGNAATFQTQIAAAQAAFVETGKPVTFLITQTAEQASFVLDAVDALGLNVIMSASYGAFNVVVVDATLKTTMELWTPASSGTEVWTPVGMN